MQNNTLNIETVISQTARFGEYQLAREVVDAFAKTAQTLSETESVAKCYTMLGDHDKSMLFAEKALELTQDKKNIQYNLVSIYRQNALPEKAIKIIDSIKDEENKNVLLIEEAGCLYEMNKRENALDVIKLIDQNNLSEYHKQKLSSLVGSLNLWNGNFKSGLIQTIMCESNVRNIEANNPNLFHGRNEINLPFWEGTPDCKKLIIYAEAGIGDEILNIRFMNHLKQKGIDPVWYGVWHQNAEANRRLGVVNLFRNSGFNVVTDLSEISDISSYMWTYSQYLPICLGLDSNELYSETYLKAPTVDLPESNLKVGIRWHGANTPRFRNYPLKQLHNILKLKNATFYSLQKDEGMDELVDFPGIIDLSKNITSFYETAKYINSMDLIITSCTSIAHCAAALGKKTFIFVPISAYYPWCHPTEKSPWYGDNVTLLRQKTPRVWDEPMAELAALLQKEII